MDRIARDGHVYQLLPPYTAAIKPTKPRATLVGYKEASTFTGFCGYHDSNTFAPIEASPFGSNQEHTFLLAYRLLCKEVFVKRADLDAMPIRRAIDKEQSTSRQLNLQTALTDYERAAMAELNHYKAAYDKALLSGDYSDVSYFIIRLAETPDLMAGGVMKPEYNFDGAQLQDLANPGSTQDIVSYSLIATDIGGAAIFTWLGQSPTGIKLTRALHAMDDAQIPHALVRFTFEHFENTFAPVVGRVGHEYSGPTAA